MNGWVKILSVFLIIIGLLGISALFYFYYPWYKFSTGIRGQTDLFRQGENDYHTYRIPALISLPDEKLLAFCEARKDSTSDYGNIDMVMRKSIDGGQNWQPMNIIWDAGNVSVQNPCPVYDKDTGILFLHLVVDRKDHYVMNSSDLGDSWSTPIKLSYGGSFMDQWDFIGPSPGHAIQLESGRLLIPGMCRDDDSNDDEYGWSSYFIYSDNHGSTWELGGIFPIGSNECLAVELDNGTIMTILRPNEKVAPSNMKLGFSHDGGNSTTEPIVSRDLVSPICQASIIRYESNKPDDARGILFGNPSNLDKRNNFTIRFSDDEGETWKYLKQIYAGPSGYSDMAVSNDGTINVILERGHIDYRQYITFIQLDLEEILSKK